AQLLDGVPEHLKVELVDVTAVDRIRVADDRDRAQLAYGPARLPGRELWVVEGELSREPEPPKIEGAVVAGPVVVGASQRGRHLGVEVVVHLDLPAASAVEDAHVDALDVH